MTEGEASAAALLGAGGAIGGGMKLHRDRRQKKAEEIARREFPRASEEQLGREVRNLLRRKLK